jgi:hypothetical protein
LAEFNWRLARDGDEVLLFGRARDVATVAFVLYRFGSQARYGQIAERAVFKLSLEAGGIAECQVEREIGLRDDSIPVIGAGRCRNEVCAVHPVGHDEVNRPMSLIRSP